MMQNWIQYNFSQLLTDQKIIYPNTDKYRWVIIRSDFCSSLGETANKEVSLDTAAMGNSCYRK